MMNRGQICRWSCLLLWSVLWGSSASATGEAEGVSPREDTVVTSEHLEMVSSGEYNHFHFKTNVEIRGNNLYASSDEMVVVVRRAPDDSNSTMGEFSGVKEIILTGNVVIKQSGREATSGKARILPMEEQVILTENPKVIDGEGVITGEEMILNKNERRAIVKGKAGARPTLTLPGFQDLSYQGNDE